MKTNSLSKKLLCILLAFQLICGSIVMGVFAEETAGLLDETVSSEEVVEIEDVQEEVIEDAELSAIDPAWVKVSSGKPVFASAFTDKEPHLAIDGDLDTAFVSAKQNVGAGIESNYGAVAERFVIDLLTATNVKAVKIQAAPDLGGDVKVYLSNDKTFVDVTEIYSGAIADDDFTEILSSAAGTFRYVLVEKASSFGISEIEVYADAENADAMNVKRVSLNKAVSANGNYSGYGTSASVIVQQGRTSYISSQNNDKAYACVDLGVAVEIPYITMAGGHQNASKVGAADNTHDTWLTHFGNLEIIATNDPADFKTPGKGTVIYSNTESIVPAPRHEMHTGMILFEVPDEIANQKFRYVGVRALKQRFQVASFGVYARGTVIEGVTGSKSGESINISGKFTEINGDVPSYTILASAFDENGNNVGTKATVQEIDGRNTTDFSWAPEFAMEPAYAKLVILDSLTNFGVKYVDVDLIGGAPANQTPAYTSNKNFEGKVASTSISVFGKAQAENLTAIMVGPDAVTGQAITFDELSEANYNENVIFMDTKEVAVGEDYEFNVTLRDDAANGTYRITVFYPDGTYETPFEFYFFSPVKDAEMTAVLNDIAADDVVSTLSSGDYAKAFGDCTAEIEACGDNFGKRFVLARDIIKAGTLSSSSTDLTSYAQFKDVIKFASLIDSLVERDDYMEYIEDYGQKFMSKAFDKNYNKDKFEAIFETVRENEDWYDDADAEITADTLLDTVKQTIGLGLVYKGSQKNVEKAITEYAEYVGVDEDTLDGNSAFAVANYISKSLTSVLDYAKNGMDSEVKDAVDDYEDEMDKHDTPSLGGGSSSSKGNSSYSGVSGLTYPQEAVNPVAPEAGNKDLVTFNDIAGYDWAKDAILNLAEEKIILGNGNGGFEPERYITREELVKIVVDMFKITTNKSDENFTDCVVTDWYYPYVMAAKYNRIVNGISETEFGAGQPVTRQDAAVILKRAMGIAGYNFSGKKEVSFADEDTFELYAIDGIITLAMNDIITGFEDGTFRPYGNTTRAEAAVMINRVYENYMKQKAEAAAAAAAAA